MADNNNTHQMNVGLGYTINTANLEQLAQITERINQASITAASSLKNIEQAVKGASGQASNYGKNMDDANKKTANLNSTTKRISNELKAGLISANDAVAQLKRRYDELNNSLIVYNQQGNKKMVAQTEAAMAKTVTAINSAQTQIKNIKRAGLDVDKAVGNQSVSETIRANNEKIANERKTVQEMTNMWQQYAAQYRNTMAQMNAQSSLKNFTAGAGSGLTRSFMNAGLSVAGVRAITNEFYQLGRAIVDIDYNLINTQRIMHDFSQETANSLLDNAIATAKATNTSITDAQEIQSSWVRINDAYADNRDLLTQISELTSKFMNVGEIEDAEHAVTLLNASLLQFNVSAEDALAKSEEFANKWAYMADITAMGTADEYGEAIAKFGANVESMNGSMDDAIALSSLMADRLAKSGAEAGTALKTFTAYMNRSKTRRLFADIAEDLGDSNYQLADANGKLKDFDENLRLIADAYQHYKDVGNDVMAQQILEAVGATRQRDTAMAVLNGVNQGDYDEYLEELQSNSVDNYLNEQNTALMETFAAQWNELVVSIQEFGMAFARSGVLDGLNLLMDGLGALFNVVSSLPQPILTSISALTGMKIAKTIAGYIGNLTGATQRYQGLINQGTAAEVANANAVSASANAYMQRMTFMAQHAQLSQEEVAILAQQQLSLANLNNAYNTGAITAEQYSQAVNNLIGQEQLNANAKYQSAEATLQSANATKRHIALTAEERAALEAETAAQNKNNAEKDESIAKDKLQDAQNKKTTVGIKSKITSYAAETFQLKKTNAQKVLAVLQEKIMNSTLMTTIASSKAATVVNNILGTSFSAAGTAAAAAATGVSLFMKALNPILMVFSVVSLVGSLFQGLFGGLFGGAEEATKTATQKLDEYKSALEEVNSKLEEMKKLQSYNPDSDVYDAEIKQLNERKQALLDNIEAQEQLQAYQKVFEDNEDDEDDNILQRAKDAAKEIKEATADYETAWQNIQDLANKGFDSKVYNEQLSEAKRTIIENQGLLFEYQDQLEEYYNKIKDSGTATAAELEDLKNTLDMVTKATENMNQTASEGSSFNFEEYVSDLETQQETLKKMKEDIDSLADGSATAEDLQRMATEYQDFYKYVGSGAQEQIRYLNELKNSTEEFTYGAIDEQIAELKKEQEELAKQLQDNEGGKIKLDDSEVEDATNRVKTLQAEIDKLEAIKEINIQVTMPSEEITSDLNLIGTELDNLNELFDEYNENGYLANETVREMLTEHPDYVKYLVKEGDQYKLNEVALGDLNKLKKDETETTDELINALKNEAEGIGLVSDEYKEALVASNEYIEGIKKTFGSIEGVNEFADELSKINNDFLNGQTNVDQYNQSIDSLIDSMDFSKVNDDLDQMDAKTKQVAQSQQAMMSSLTSNVANFLRDATVAFQDGEMSVQQYTDALTSTNGQLLDIYTKSNDLTLSNGQWVNAAGEVDQYANSLQNAMDKLDGMSAATQFLSDNYQVLSEISAAVAQGQVDDAWWAQMQTSSAYQAMVNDFGSAMSYMYENNHGAWEAIASDVAKANGMTVEDTFNANGSISEGVQLSAAAVNSGVNSMISQLSASISNAASAGGDVISSLGNMISSFDYTIKATPFIQGGFNIDFKEGKIELPSFGFKIEGSGGSSVQKFASSLKSFGESISKVDFGSLISLDSFRPTSSYKPVGSSGLGGSGYKPSDYNRPTAQRPTSSSSKKGSSGSSGKSDAEKAAEDAAKAAEEAAEAVEKLTEQYVKNVESMQDRIANALKKKYQEQYDERKKLLEKEHNDRIEQIQSEIDAINGERPEDKQAELDRLESQLEKWMADDSTLGKAKQKEYMDQIEELKKEIKLDELEQQMEEENERYEQSIDSESEFYDAILKKLDDQMTDEKLYREANDMIRNQKTQEIIDLLTEFDSQWDGWATLMGKTAGQIIAEEVALAIANYKDVVNGTITPDGGKYTNKVTGGSSSSSSGSTKKPSGGSSSSSLKKGSRVKITNTSAGMYYTSSSKSAVDNWKGWTGSYYIVNTANGRYALGRSKSISSAIGWIDKKYVKRFATGGYTGSDEGLAYLHSKERVLNAKQTSAFENLVYDFLPRIESDLLKPVNNNNNTTTTNNNGNVFNKELVSVNIDKIVNNTPFDVQNTEDNLDRAFRTSLRKAGINLKR